MAGRVNVDDMGDGVREAKEERLSERRWAIVMIIKRGG